MSIKFPEFYQLYVENKNKIHMKPEDGIGTHPVNKEAVQRWKEKISDLENDDERNFYTFFADAFSSILETSYITYTVFLTTLNAVAEEIFTLIKSTNYDNIVFMITGEMDKSNIWVSLLMMDYWDSKAEFFNQTNKIKIHSFLTDDPPNLEYLELETKKNLFIHFDDMSYSGGQAAQSIATVWQRSTIKPTNENVDYYLAIPYITTTAKKYISKHIPGVKYFPSTVVVPSFIEQVKTYYDSLPATENSQNMVYFKRIKEMCHPYWFVKISGTNNSVRYKIERQKLTAKNLPLRNSNIRYMPKYSPPDEIEKGVWAFRCSSFKTLIYFDHKLADDASTFQKVLYFGSYPINSNIEPEPICEHESLITGCQIDEKVLQMMRNKRSNACRSYIQYGSKEWNIDQKVICPKTFYKEINYTLCKVKDRFYERVNEKIVESVREKIFVLNKKETFQKNLDSLKTGLDYGVFLDQVPRNQKSGVLAERMKQCFSGLDKKKQELEIELGQKLRFAGTMPNYGNIEFPTPKPNPNASLLNRFLGSFTPFGGRKLKTRSTKSRKSKTLKKKTSK